MGLARSQAVLRRRHTRHLQRVRRSAVRSSATSEYLTHATFLSVGGVDALMLERGHAFGVVDDAAKSEPGWPSSRFGDRKSRRIEVGTRRAMSSPTLLTACPSRYLSLNPSATSLRNPNPCLRLLSLPQETGLSTCRGDRACGFHHAEPRDPHRLVLVLEYCLSDIPGRTSHWRAICVPIVQFWLGLVCVLAGI